MSNKSKKLNTTSSTTTKPTKKTIITAIVVFGFTFLLLGFAVGICLGALL